MCCLCDADDVEDEAMADPWSSLYGEVLATLKDGVASFLKDTKPELEAFLKEKALQIAKEKWRSLNAPTDVEREVAEVNLRHLAAQVGGKVVELQLAATKEAQNLLVKVLEVAAGILIRIGPEILKS